MPVRVLSKLPESKSMKPCLVDVNVWFALLVLPHEHHEKASQWYDSLEAGNAVMCRNVQLALIRLLTNKTILPDDAIAAHTAWDMLTELAGDERVAFLNEPLEFETTFPTLLRYPAPTTKLVSDAYLAAFALAASLPIVTFDRGFRQFRGLEVILL